MSVSVIGDDWSRVGCVIIIIIIPTAAIDYRVTAVAAVTSELWVEPSRGLEQQVLQSTTSSGYKRRTVMIGLCVDAWSCSYIGLRKHLRRCDRNCTLKAVESPIHVVIPNKIFVVGMRKSHWFCFSVLLALNTQLFCGYVDSYDNRWSCKFDLYARRGYILALTLQKT